MLLAVGLRWLDRRSGGPPTLRAQAALIGTVSVLVASACAGPIAEAVATLRAAAGLQRWGLETTGSWSADALRQSIMLALYLSLWTLVFRFLQRSRRSAQRLAAAQARGIDAERRMLAEQLAGAQAMVEPAFLFDTLQLADRLFDRDTGLAQRLLDELHRYLRAALPPADGSASTLGQQAELLRARLAIESIRLDGRLAVRIDIPAALAAQPLAPLLLPPLVANALRHAVEPLGGGEIAVQASEHDGRLMIEVADCGPRRAAGMRDDAALKALRERLTTLYGEHATLVFADRVPRGLAARIGIDIVAGDPR